MTATAELLAQRPFADIRITEIARGAQIAQPHFYAYFSSIEEVVLALCEEISVDHLADYLDVDWRGEKGVQPARDLIEAFLEFWRLHGAIFSVASVLADNQHSAFAAARVRHMRQIYKGFEKKVREGQEAGRISSAIQPRLAGYECVGILVSTAQRHRLFRHSGFSNDDLVETTARLIHILAVGLES